MNALILTGNAWESLKEQATMLVKSGFLPKGIDTPEKALAIAIKGHEMGIPPMQAFSHISIVQGKPCISSELMLAQIYKNVPGAKVDILKSDESEAVISAKRPGERATTFSFSMEDAKRAALTGKSTWAQYPKVMLIWRAVSMMARSKFPDAIMGCSYTPEEMGAEVEIGEDGQILDVKVEQKAAPAPQPKLTSVPAPTPQVQKAAPNPKGPRTYTGQEDFWQLMKVNLKTKKIPEEVWPQIKEGMMNKTSAEFGGVVDNVMQSYVENQREPGFEEDEIPFK